MKWSTIYSIGVLSRNQSINLHKLNKADKFGKHGFKGNESNVLGHDMFVYVYEMMFMK